MEPMPIDGDVLDPGTIPYQMEFEQPRTDSAARRLRKMAQRLDYSHTTTKLLSDSPGGTIVSYADEHDADLILLAHCCRSGLERLSGSITARAVKHVSCDILSLRV